MISSILLKNKKNSFGKKASASFNIIFLMMAFVAGVFIIGQLPVISAQDNMCTGPECGGLLPDADIVPRVAPKIPQAAPTTAPRLPPTRAWTAADAPYCKSCFDKTPAGSWFTNPGDKKSFFKGPDGKVYVGVDGNGNTIYSPTQAGPSATPTPAAPGAEANPNNQPSQPCGGNKPCGDKGGNANQGSSFDIGNSLLQGLQYGALGFGLGYMIGGLLGWNEDQTLALAAALGGGGFAYGFASGAGLGTLPSLGIGLGVAAIIFILLYKEIEIKIVSFQCMAWQPPYGGNDCEICNNDDLPCSEYRCRSLGQNCELVNPGTSQETCVNVNPQDVNPPIITPDENELTFGHEYVDVRSSPPGPGFRIIKTDSPDGCVKAFTPLEFGIITDEPSQCKIDWNSTETFDDMLFYMDQNNMFLYKHKESFLLPGAEALAAGGFALQNGKDLEFYIRCIDKNGNENEAEYAVKFCMDPSPDTTAPQIKATSIIDGGCVAAETDSARVEFYTDEPSVCKWSHVDQDYDQMENTMFCPLSIYEFNGQPLFTCIGDMSGIARDGTDFYVRCKDQPQAADNDRNKNAESYKFSLRGSTELKMKNLRPNSTIFAGVSPAPIELYAETLFGCDAGKAVCYYSRTDNLNDYVKFFDTETTDGIHTQRQDLGSGEHTYYIRCVDSGGNVATDTTTFTVEIDTSAPEIARIYEESGMLKIVTLRNSQCSYSFNDCDFTFEEGTEMPYGNTTVHVAEWNKDQTYFIKCRDEFLNENADCSAIVRPSQNFL